MATQGLTERVDGQGRTRVFRFAEPSDCRPAKLAKVRRLGDYWQEWEHGIGGNKPAKEWTSSESKANSTYSRRLPIYLLLQRLIHRKKKLPAEAFRLVTQAFGNDTSLGKVSEAIRIHEENGTMPMALADRSNPLALSKKRKRRNMDPLAPNGI